MLPKEREIEIPLLKALVDLGGQGKPSDIYPLVTRYFPNVSPEEFLKQLSTGGNKWTNRIQWVRQKLIVKGFMSSPE